MSPHGVVDPGHYGRLFEKDHLEAADPDVVDRLAAALGRFDDPMDENDAIPAGYTYFGQFIDHDLTFDPTQPDDPVKEPKDLENRRTARFDLDSVYGGGPEKSAHLYALTGVPERFRKTKFLLRKLAPPDPHDEHEVPAYDLPRNADGTAIIADDRNDENQITSQLHVLFLRFHNAVVDHIAELQDRQVAAGLRRPETVLAQLDLFEAARREVLWHYQYVVRHDWLPTILGPDTLAMVERHRPFQGRMPADGAIPVEFSGAAFRFGHTLVRRDYRLKKVTGKSSVPIFDPNPDNGLNGHKALTHEHRIFWTTFFQFPGRKVQPSMLIDHLLAPPLVHVPPKDESLYALNLKRGVKLGLPAGTEVARTLRKSLPANIPTRWRVRELSSAELWSGFPKPDPAQKVNDPTQDPAFRSKVAKRTPLWFYILREAATLRDGKHLGPVGGAIVGEVILSLLERDPDFYLNQTEVWESRLWPGDTQQTGTMGRWSLFLLQAYVHYERNWANFLRGNRSWSF